MFVRLEEMFNCQNFLKAKSGRPPSMGEINLNHRWPNNKVGPLPDPVKRKLFENDFSILNWDFLDKRN